MFNVSGHGNMEAYVIQGAEINNNLTNPLLEQVAAMYTEATPECFVDQGLYYPTATNYGYYCTGFESPGEWEDHERVFGIDGPEVQYAGTQTESLPYVYYTPSYGYAQSPYNPYNPYIPGAMMGADGPYIGAQQYYTIPPYQDPVSSPGYIPIVAQSDINPNSLVDSSIETGVAFAGRSDGQNWEHGLASSSTSFSRNFGKRASNQTNSFPRISEVPRSNAGTGKQSMRNKNISSGFPTPQSRVLESRSASGSIQALDNISSGKVLPHSSQLKVSVPVNGDFADFGPSSHGRTGVDRMRTKFQGARTLNVVNGDLDGLGEQNRGPRTNKLKNQFVVKAYTTTVGNTNSQGNIIICADHYNKDDFLVDYVHAKFFVIKSYSEDDVHKSLKYNVWSSTPHGNKKLQGAYEEAQMLAAGRPRGCPIFLFFSVNASGQFCGVAEMIGPVDFHKDMDFWLQDKWSGSFPVKWHIIKDVPNASVRHIILENNENKPVTNSRDTQEIMYKQGLEMLKIFKNHSLKTSLLDDFMYYENHQKIMQEEKARFIFKSFDAPLLAPALDPNQKINHFVELSPNKEEKIMEQNNPDHLNETELSTTDRVYSNSSNPNLSMGENPIKTVVKDEDDIAPAMEISSLDINTKQAKPKPLPDASISVANCEPIEVVTVGSVPVKVNGYAEPPIFLTVGTIPLDPRALRAEKSGAFPRCASQNN